MHLHLWLYLIISLSIAFPLGAVPASAAKTEANDSATVVLQLKWLHQFQFAGYYAAVEKGFYRDAGLNVVFKEGRPGLDITDELLAGRADYLVSNPSALLVRSAGKPVIALAAIFQHSPLVLIARTETQILKPTDLIGRRVMLIPEVETELLAMCINEGVEISQIDIFPHSWGIGDLMAGKIDAMSAYLTDTPLALQKETVDFNVIRPLTYGIDFYGDVLFTSEKEINQHQERVIAFREASLRGWAYAMANPEELIDLILAKYSTRRSREELLVEANAMKPLILPDLVDLGHMNPGRWQHIADTYIKLNLLPKDFSLEGFLFRPEEKNLWNRRTLQIVALILVLCGSAVLLLLFFNRRLRAAVQKRTLELSAKNRDLMAESAERQKINEALSESEGRFRTLVDNIPGVVYRCSIDRNRTMLFLSEEVKTVTGYHASDFIDNSVRSFVSIIVPEDQAQVERIINESVQQRQPYTLEFRILHADGTTRWIFEKSQAVFSPAGEAMFLDGVFIDNTERKRAEDELKESTEKFISLADNVPGHVAYVDANTLTYQYVNGAFEKSFGIPQDKITGSHIKELLGEKNYHIALKYIEEVRAGKSVSYENTFDLVSGERWVRVNYTPVFDDKGQVVSIAVLSYDITDHKQIEEELIKAKAAAESANITKSAFLANMSHELRTPMAGIIGMLDVALAGELSEPQRGHLQVVEKSANTLMRILNEILDFSKIEAGVLALIEAPFHLHETVRGVVELFELEAQRKGLYMVVDIAPDTPQIVEGDEGRFRQILVNLVGNAIKFTERGQVAIRVKAGEITAEGQRDTILTVTDTGIGIPEDKQKSLFQPFSQADASDSRRYGGTGLGLSISQTLAERMGGTICFSSKSGQGTVFVVILPLRETTAIPALTEDFNSRPVLADTYRAHLLVAEDDSSLRTLIGIQLQQKGISFDFACNGAEVVEMWTRGVYDLILMDIQMPLMNGYQATRAIRELESDQGGHVPIVALTAGAYQVDQQKCLQAGMDAYLAKPIKFENLFSLIGRLLDIKEVGKIQ